MHLAIRPGTDAEVLLALLHVVFAEKLAAADLAGFATGLDLKGPARWLFPNGPMKIPGAGRAWFPISEERLSAYGRGEGAFDLSSLRPDGLDAARDAVLAFISALEVPWEKVILGGFSQGAMLSVELALATPEAPRGVFLLSGNLVDAAGLVARAPGRKGLRFFQSHGTLDPLLGYEGGRKLHETLLAAGWEGSFLDFPGQHAIPGEVLEGLGAFLDSLL